MQNKEPNQESVRTLIDDFNPGLFVHIIQKSLKWVLFFLILSTTLSYIYLRYTPRIFQSVSTLMLKTQETSQVLGISDLMRDDESEINREIQLLKSRLILDRALATLPLDVSYFRQGRSRFFNTELYQTSPFQVNGKLLDPRFEGVPVYIEILDKYNYKIKYSFDDLLVEDVRTFGETLESQFFKISIQHDPKFRIDKDKAVYFFKFNDRNKLIGEYTSRVEVLPLIQNTKTVQILLKDQNKQKANDIINAITQEFLQHDKERKAESIFNVLDFLNQQIDTFGSKFVEFQDTVKYFRLETGFVAPQKQIDLMVDKLEELETKKNETVFDLNLTKWLTDYLDSEKDLRFLSVEELSSSVGGVSHHIEKINELKKEKKNLLLDVTQDHPSVRLIDEEINTTMNYVKLELDNTVDRNDYKLQLINEEYQTYLKELIQLPDKESKFSQLMQESKMQEDFYLNLIEKRSQYEIAKAGIVSDYIVLQEATAAINPISPNTFMIRILGVLSGLLLGVILILFRYFLHNEIVSIEDVKHHTNAAILGVVPRYKINMSRSQIVVTQNPKSLMSEAFRTIRANLQFIPSKSDSKVVAVTSTISGEGKTFIVLNLAAIHSMMDKKVIILDFDLRKPRIDRIFEVESHRGLSTILIGKSKIEDCIYNTGIKNLDFITSGPVPPNPSELIMLPKTQEIIEDLKKDYDYILIDTPPIGLVTDGLELIKMADFPIYAVRADYSKKNFIDNVNKIVRENKIENLSLVMNDFGRGASAKAYSYGYGSGYGYGYGHGYGYGVASYGGYYTEDSNTNLSWWKKMKSRF
ncbi:MAG: polysaccharide biosynthesis tyrosine autokinase [Chitinophagales bacterium]|nr:polysaccharide biosynthesis tyrosine autokinase [Chitinophagales bacterium]